VANRATRWQAWAWFGAWFMAGAACVVGVLGALTIGIIVLPIAGAATAFLATRRTSSVGIAGLISGAGVPVLLVAYFNRDGPGDICKATAGGSSCTQEWSPWPWLAVGVAVVVVGVFMFVRSARQRIEIEARS